MITGHARSDRNLANLCSRKLLDLLRDRDWRDGREKTAIEEELLKRGHYLPELAALTGHRRTSSVTATRH